MDNSTQGRWSEDPIVVSGMSGKCANSNNVAELKHQLYNKMDMITANNNRYQRTPETPERYGAIPTIDKFDNAFFGIPEKQVDYMDPICRIVLESTCEALWDAGMSLQEVRGKRAGVFIGNCYSESEMCIYHPTPASTFPLLGSTRVVLTQRLHHFLKVDGPSYIVDSACSSSFYCLDLAAAALRNDEIDFAIISGHNLILTPGVSAQFYRLGVLSQDGSCKSFDAHANGYARSDGGLVAVLQRASAARRHYADVVECMTNCDGFKGEGITFPSGARQEELLREFYARCKVPLERVGFVEAHGTGTRVGDVIELNALDRFYCERRTAPLLIGSVKSSVGHSEGGSGMASLVKACLIFETDIIPPNINFNVPHPSVEALHNGRLQVVTECMPMPSDRPYVAISNYGFGGANGHVLLTYPKVRATPRPDDGVPRLVCVSGRTDEALAAIMHELQAQPYDPDFVALLNSALSCGTRMHDHRAFAIMTKAGLRTWETRALTGATMVPLRCVFHEVGVIGLHRSLQQHFPVYRKHVENIFEMLVFHHIDKTAMWREASTTAAALVTVLVQTGIVEILKILQVRVSKYVGIGCGQISASYANGTIGLEAAVLAAHCITELMRNRQNAEKATLLKEFANHDVNEDVMQPQDDIENLFIVGGCGTANSREVNYNDSSEQHADFLHTLGKLYIMGYGMSINQLYDIQWPVHKGTGMIAHLIKWQHKKTWNYLNLSSIKAKDVNQEVIKMNDPEWAPIEGHNIDGRVLFPATGYIFLAWKWFMGKIQKPLVFENVSFLRACTITPNSDLCLTYARCKQSGRFDIMEGDAVVVTGTLRILEDFDREWLDLPALQPKNPVLMSRKDIYKELALRGYYYQGQFREMQDCDTDATTGNIKWTDWVPFMDTMLQMKILSEDTRSLFVPTQIRRLIINPERHLDVVYSNKDFNNCEIPIYHYKHLDIIRCGFVEIRGMTASSIMKRKNPTPVLETNRFVPYVAKLDVLAATRVMVQIALENSYAVKIKAMENFHGVPETLEPILPHIQDALNDQPLIQPEFILYAKSKLATVVDVPMSERIPTHENGCFITVAYSLSTDANLLIAMRGTLRTGGFLISREALGNKATFPTLTVICEYTTNHEKLVLLKVPELQLQLGKAINIKQHGFEWLKPLQQARLNKENLLLISENEPYNGVMGLTNCLLKESGNEKIMNVLIDDETAPKFDAAMAFYQRQLAKNMSINVLQNGVWGSYRHLHLDQKATITSTHGYVNNMIKGDVSSLTWMQGNLFDYDDINHVVDAEETVLVHIYNAAVNFKDVMLASGKLSVDSLLKRREQNCPLGIEFAGRTASGKRVMGIVLGGALANVILVSGKLLWDVPTTWSLADAATVPCIYATNIYGLLVRAKLQQGDSILIHSATGGIGLSALNIALYYKCHIFVTVGTEEKRRYIQERYPAIPPANIGNSRDTSFYEMILKRTNGSGVNVILNSLADEKLQVSVKCLAQHGRFVEIGKYDCMKNSPLHVDLAEREAEYHGVMLDILITSATDAMCQVGGILRDGLIKGYIKPIPLTLFGHDEIEKAFRFMATGKHIGKTVINIRQEESAQVLAKPDISMAMTSVRAKFYCNPSGTYVILGGLGGFGLELADWLALRGAQNIVLVSRSGLSTGYQQMRIGIWRQYGCKVHISQDDVATEKGCTALLYAAQQMGEIVGVFNLAVVLRDAVIENQTEETFVESYNPKALATIHLDKCTRSMAPKLKHFVVFSSVSCGRGNAGQCNYGYSNSVMERVCERRRRDGLPGTAIQWGIVGDVGIVADFKEQNIEVVIGGTMHQRIANCLEMLDLFMTSDAAIVSSMVVAEKKAGGGNDMLSTVLRLLQITDVKTVSPSSTFPELGMDSMMAVEIKQTLEREFDVFLSPQDLRNMNITKLNDIAAGGSGSSSGDGGGDGSGKVAPAEQNTPDLIQQLMRFVPSEEQSLLAMVCLKQTDSPMTLYLIPGVEGMANVFADMAESLTIATKCLQFPYNITEESIPLMAQNKFALLRKELRKEAPFLLAAHSLGCTVALEVLSLLESDGYTGTLVLLDASPDFNRIVLDAILDTTSDDRLQVSWIMYVIAALMRFEQVESLQKALTAATSYRNRCQVVVNQVPDPRYSDTFRINLLTSVYHRVKAELTHDFKPRRFRSRIVLCKASIGILSTMTADYGLRQTLAGGPMEMKQFVGDHVSFLQNKDFIEYIEHLAATC